MTPGCEKLRSRRKQFKRERRGKKIYASRSSIYTFLLLDWRWPLSRRIGHCSCGVTITRINRACECAPSFVFTARRGGAIDVQRDEMKRRRTPDRTSSKRGHLLCKINKRASRERDGNHFDLVVFVALYKALTVKRS